MPINRRRIARDPDFNNSDDDKNDDFTTEDDDEDDAPPARRGLGKRVRGSAEAAFKSGAEEGKTRPKARDDDEDDDEDDDAEDAVSGGWAAAKRAKSMGGGFVEEFKFEAPETLVKFLADDPFAVFGQHWIDSGLKTTKKKSFICLGKRCPLCAIGDSPRPQFAFNIAVIDDDGVVILRSLLAGSRLLSQIESAHASKTNGPISKGFWVLSRTGKKQTTAYNLQYVKPRDLEEDFQIDADDVAKQIGKLKPYTKDAYKPMARSALQELANELTDDDEDDDDED